MEAQFLEFSRSLGIYGFMNSPWGWPIAESIHFIGLSMLIGAVGLFDLRMLGFVKTIPLAAMHKLVPFGVAGFLLNVTTGVMFITTVPDQYLYNPAVQSKFLFLAAAGINMLLFYLLCYRQVSATHATTTALTKAKIFALISLTCWLGVIACGRLITFYRPPFYWCIWCS
ncbi:MAG: DUF6644 family protein [Pseudohongiellaceae bacterium]